MAHINLLPWREERRAECRRRFLMALSAAVITGILTIIIANQVINSRINYQKQRNVYLKQHIAQLDAQVAEIRDFRRKRAQLTERIRIIQGLQDKRPIIVRVMDELVRTVPDGIFYTSLMAKEGTIFIQGVTESNNQVSNLMRNIEASNCLAEASLNTVRAAPDFGKQATSFSLTVNLNCPNSTANGAKI